MPVSFLRPRTTRTSLACFSAAAACLLMLLSFGRNLSAAEPMKIDFAHEIVPLLKAKCGECHTSGQYKGSLSLDTRQALLESETVTPGKSGESELLRRLLSTDDEERMPPKGDPLSAEQIALVKRWIDDGLPWEPGFSFRGTGYKAPLKPRKPELPPIQAGREHPIDRLIDAYFVEHELPFPEPIDDATFGRRASLDLVGLLPSAAQVQALAENPSSEKRAEYVQSLLSDRRAYSDHWLTFWNDLLRNDYRGTGFIDGGRKQISVWLYQSLVDNKPYDQFARELINPTPEAEGFIHGIKWRGRVNASQVPEVQFSQNVSQVFFGINMKCASCHDSFIDDWKLDDAYSLAAIVADKPLEIYRCDKATGKIATPRFVWPELGAIDADAPKAKRLEQLSTLITSPDNGRFARTIANRMWHRLMGRGLVHPVDMMGTRPWNEDLLDYLGAYLTEQNYDLKKLLEHIVTSRIYQSQPAVTEEEIIGESYVFRGPEVKRMTAEQFLDAVWQLTDTGPKKADAPAKLPGYSVETTPSQHFIRAALVHSDPLMRSLGRPNREQVVTTRGDVLTTLQALDLANGQILTSTLERGAANLLKEQPNRSPEELVDALYWQSLSRAPTADERAVASQFVGSPMSAAGLSDLLWTLCMLPEFQLIH